MNLRVRLDRSRVAESGTSVRYALVTCEVSAQPGERTRARRRAAPLPDASGPVVPEPSCVREAAVVFVAGSGVDVAPLCGFTTNAAGSVTRVELGDLAAGQPVTLLVQITTRAESADVLTLVVRTAAKERGGDGAGTLVVLTPVPFGEAEAEPRDPVVTLAVAEYLAALARLDLVEKHRVGDVEGARQVLDKAVATIVAIAQGDASVLAVATALRAETGAGGARSAPTDGKRGAFAGTAMLTSPGRGARTGRTSAK